MHSSRTSILLILLIFSLGACSYFFEAKDKVLQISYEQEVGGCMTQANRMLVNYFDKDHAQQIIEAEVNNFTSCYQEAITAMVLHTRSGRSQPDDFSAENIEMLIKRLHPEIGITHDKIQFFIQLKHFLLGGSIDTISKSELNYINDQVLPRLATFLKTMEPYRNIILNGWGAIGRRSQLDRDEASHARFREAYSQLRAQIADLIAVFDQKNRSGSIDLARLFQQFVTEFVEDDPQSYLKHQELLLAFKNLSLNETGVALPRGQLGLFFNQGLRVAESLSQFNYFLADDEIFVNIGSLAIFITRVPALLRDSSMFKGVALRSLLDIVENLEEFLVLSSGQAADGDIPFVKMEQTLLSLRTSEIMNGPLTPESLSIFLRRFTRKWLLPHAGDSPNLNRGKVEYLKDIVVKWVRRQQLANTLFSRVSGQSVSLSQALIELPSSQILADWAEIFRATALHQWDTTNKVVKYSRNTDEMTYEDFTISNSTWTMVELFTAPYNLNKNRVFDYAITSDQAQEIYAVLRVLGVEMRFMDSREFNSGHRTFSESNNFSTQLRNDEYLDFFESYEYLSVAFSAGQLSELVYTGVPTRCLRDYPDVLGRNVIEAQCFRGFIKSRFSDFFGHLTTVNSFWQTLNSSQKDSLLDVIAIASRGGVITDKPYDMGEIRVFVSVMYYIQSIFFVFDLNRDGRIAGAELISAERQFRELVADFILTYPNSDELFDQINRAAWWFVSVNWDANRPKEELAHFVAPKVFIFLLTYGRLPETRLDKLRFARLLDQGNEDRAFQRTQATVEQVLSVFAAIATITHKSHIDRIANFLLVHQEELLNQLNTTDHTPQCLERSEYNVFCRWARVIFCNEPVNEYLFQWMRENQFATFRQDLWRRNRGESIVHSLQHLSFNFRTHMRFSTQCNFPHVADDFEFNP
jgi:hypothetical protein